MKLSYLLVLILISTSIVSAHQPRLVYNENLSMETPKEIHNPQISQAFYADLKGSPEYYSMSEPDFNLYLQILSPAIADARTDFIVEIAHYSDLIILNGTNYSWTKFHEDFANDDYFQGPEIEFNASGEYLIKVSNSDNTGKYVLVVGKEEAFPLNEAINAYVSMPQLKRYFNKSILTSFYNILGIFLLIILIILAVLVYLTLIVIRKIRKNRSRRH
jgi:hypothetical protein